MDWARVAGSVISLWLGGAFSDSDTPNTDTPDFQIDPNLYKTEDLGLEVSGDAGVGMEAKPTPQETQQTDGIIAKWAKDLSPQAQQVVAKAIAGGAAGLMQGIAQKNAEEDRREREERAREDKKRRGAIQAFGANAYAPRGIIGPRMG